MKTHLRFSAFLLFVAAVCFAQDPTPKPASRSAAAKPVVAHAAWYPFWQTSVGMSEEDFKKAGLDQLTSLQGTSLWTTIFTHRPYVTCGRFYGSDEKNEYNFVHIFVTGNTSDVEFVGRLRLKISAIKDVKMAPSSDDADLTISILSVSNEVGSTRVGMTVATTVTEVCTLRTTTDGAESNFAHEVNALINAGPDEDGLASRIANSVEASNFDSVRQAHAQALKLLPK